MLAVLGHAALILVGYAVLDDLGWLAELGVLMDEYEDMTTAVVAVGILVAIGLLAIRAVRTVLPYELWKFLHLLHVPRLVARRTGISSPTGSSCSARGWPATTGSASTWRRSSASPGAG